MNNRKSIEHLSKKWIKAAILGTIWASSEIVLGSFLHNLKIPFAGNILTAIGLVILISASYKWKEKGLFWRAGIICAFLKTMSPSAVIFGPMVAITSEALLMEISVRFLGRNYAGFITGSVLAMSWNLMQKIVNFIIFYGYNIVEVYANLMRYAERQLHLKFNAVWGPLLILLIIYAAFGAFAAIVGIRTGKKIADNKSNPSGYDFRKATTVATKTEKSIFSYSIFWLVLNLILMAGTLLLIGQIPFRLWVLLVIAVVLVWALRYNRALRQLVKPKFWIFFVLITILTALVFSRLQTESTSLKAAVLIGIEMNLRAIVLIMGFTVLGTELYNPKIRHFFQKSRFRQLPLALELSFESLPAMVANVPDVKSLLKNPGVVVQQMMQYADFRLQEIKNSSQTASSVFITGEIGAGKTTFLKAIISKLKTEGHSISGFYSERIINNEQTSGYDLVDIESGKKTIFLRTEGNVTQQKIGRYYIYPEAFALAEQSAKRFSGGIFILDEVGRLELEGKGWHNTLMQLTKLKKAKLLLVVRKEFQQQIIEKYGLLPRKIFLVSQLSTEKLQSAVIIKLYISPINVILQETKPRKRAQSPKIGVSKTK